MDLQVETPRLPMQSWYRKIVSRLVDITLEIAKYHRTTGQSPPSIPEALSDVREARHQPCNIDFVLA